MTLCVDMAAVKRYGPLKFDTSNGGVSVIMTTNKDSVKRREIAVDMLVYEGKRPGTPSYRRFLSLTLEEYIAYFGRIDKMFGSVGKFDESNGSRKFNFELNEQDFSIVLTDSGKLVNFMQASNEHLRGLLLVSFDMREHAECDMAIERISLEDDVDDTRNGSIWIRLHANKDFEYSRPLVHINCLEGDRPNTVYSRVKITLTAQEFKTYIGRIMEIHSSRDEVKRFEDEINGRKFTFELRDEDFVIELSSMDGNVERMVFSREHLDSIIKMSGKLIKSIDRYHLAE